jgi:UDP-N-acetylmuramyl tripeptide synthase
VKKQVPKENIYAIDNLPGKLGEIAADFYGDPSGICKVIGITGTNGKTTCSHWLAQAWRQEQVRLACDWYTGLRCDIRAYFARDGANNTRCAQ